MWLSTCIAMVTMTKFVIAPPVSIEPTSPLVIQSLFPQNTRSQASPPGDANPTRGECLGDYCESRAALTISYTLTDKTLTPPPTTATQPAIDTTTPKSISAGVTPSATPKPSRRLRITLSISISIGALLIISCLAIGIRQYRKNKRIQTPVIPRVEHQPYLQQKGELDADGNAVYEKDGMERRQELDPDSEIHEMSAGSVAGGDGGRGL